MGQNAMGGQPHSSWAPGSSPAIPWLGRACDWQQGCAGTGLPRNPNPLLWEGRSQPLLLRPNLPCCPGFQLQAQLCPKLQCKVRHSRKPLQLQILVCPSPSPVLHRSLGSQLHTDLGMQLAELRLHHTPSITQHCYPFKSIHVLKNLEKPCCLILSKVPGIHFHFHLWTFYSAPNIETYSTKSTHSSLLRCLCSKANDRDSSAVTGCRTRHLWKSHFGNRKYSL